MARRRAIAPSAGTRLRPGAVGTAQASWPPPTRPARRRPGHLPLGFVEFVDERIQIRLRREAGMPVPWTEVPELQEWRFCEAFREWDRTTAWFRRFIRGPQCHEERVVWSCMLFRMVNRIETAAPLLTHGLFTTWSARRALAALRGVRPVTNAAYRVLTPPGYTKGEGIVRIVSGWRKAHPSLPRQLVGLGHSLEAAHARLMELPYLGPFLAYEIVTDLRHTAVLGYAKDRDTWANPGPGARRGLGWLSGEKGRPVKDTGLCIDFMRQILEQVRIELPLWEWELRDVEHSLCEFDKYRRAHAGRRLKRRYHPPAQEA